MEKQQVIALIQSQLRAGTITDSDLLGLASGEARDTSRPAEIAVPGIGRTQRNLVNIFYAIGAIIVLTGVVILMAQYWSDIGFIGRVLATAGIALASYGAGLLYRGSDRQALSQAFFAIATALAPLGAYVVLSENRIEFGFVEQAITAAGLAALMGFAWFLTRRSILVLSVIVYLTWAYYAVLLKALEGVTDTYASDVLIWATLTAGAAYILIGYGYESIPSETKAGREDRAVRALLYGLGTLGALGAGFSLEGTWDLSYFLLLFAAFSLSVFVRSRAMLVFAAVFLIAHLIYLTSEYFAEAIGWPVALILCGFIVIGIGYGSFRILKEYIR